MRDIGIAIRYFRAEIQKIEWVTDGEVRTSEMESFPEMHRAGADRDTR